GVSRGESAKKMGTVKEHSLPQRLERVIEEAESLFVEEGFLHFGTMDLARRLRCSKRTLYSIAPTREKFFELILEHHLERMNREMVEAARIAPDCVAALIAPMETAIAAFGNESNRFNNDVKSFPGGVRALKRTHKQRQRLTEETIARGVRIGVFRKIDPQLVAAALHAAANAVTDPQYLSSATMTWAEALREVFRLFFQGLLQSSEAEEVRGLRSTNANGPRRRVAAHQV
ncbi:MAG TPA: TetR/AcrR family transcriptional regulator, partial [Candidatus Binataceae bacterium]|nr:TetR/AcrR family transcriptional regulator [Candidatus Binataceae bacterium]